MTFVVMESCSSGELDSHKTRANSVLSTDRRYCDNFTTNNHVFVKRWPFFHSALCIWLTTWSKKLKGQWGPHNYLKNRDNCWEKQRALIDLFHYQQSWLPLALWPALMRWDSCQLKMKPKVENNTDDPSECVTWTQDYTHPVSESIRTRKYVTS